MRRSTALASAAAVALAAAAAGCAAVKGVAQTAGHAYLRKKTPGGTDPLLRQAIDAGLHAAVRALEEAWARRVAERREADARLEEERRLQTAEAQLFYAELCTAKAPPLGAAPAPVRAPTFDASEEEDAEAAYAAGDYARAARLLTAAYEDRKADVGGPDPELARVANRLAVARLAAGDELRDAIAPALEALELRKALLAAAERGAPDSPARLRADLDVAESETTVAQIFRAGGAFEEARAGLRHALEVRARHLGGDHLCVAQSENALGEVEYLTGRYPAAMERYRSALATRERSLPEGHRDLAQSYLNLGSLHAAVGLYDAADGYYQRALANRRTLGDDHPEIADLYHHLAALRRATGDLPEAEALYQRALAIRRARHRDGLEVAATETALAELLFSYGDDARAAGLLEHAHAIRKARLPAGHPDLAESLAALARLHQARLELGTAEAEARAALGIWEGRFGPDHPVVAVAAAELGELYLAQGRLEEAEASLGRARSIRERKLGPDHPATAESLHQLGALYYARCDYGRAEGLFRSAVEIRTRRLGEDHPDVALSLSYLAALLVATDRGDEAVPTFRRAQLVSERLLREVGPTASAARFDALLRSTRAQEEVVYSLAQHPALARRAAPLLVSLALLRKGRSIDEAASLSRTVYQALPGEARARFEELRLLRAQVARQRLSPWAATGGAEQVLAEADRVEQELARHAAPVRARREIPGLDEVVAKVAAALPARAVLVEAVEYRAYRFAARPGEPRWGAPRYAAMVLDAGGAVHVADLGAAAPIDGGVKAVLQAITGDAGDAVSATREAARALDARVLEPIRPFLAGSASLVLSLDGQLNLLPFSVLFDGREHLVDRYGATYVTSGRDLLPRASPRRSGDVVLLAKPEFVKGGAVVAAAAGGAERGLFEVLEDGSRAHAAARLAPGALKLKAPPSPLPGTEEEARAIGALLPRAQLVLGADATKERFLGLSAPGIVHVATHGLFLPDAAARKPGARGLDRSGALLSPAVASAPRSDPLLDSMLLWAHVGTPVPGGGGSAVVLEPAGLTTALEVAGMNLWGTQLVVLSACETGRSRVDDLGQGVFGLRRAVMVAGAETLITSLWKVDDAVTRDLMTAYYTNLLAGLGRGEALRRASLAVRERHPEPRHWAPFIAIGQVGPIVDPR